MVMKFFVSELIGVNMAKLLNGKLVISKGIWGEFVVWAHHETDDHTVYEVLNGKGEPACKNVWQTYDGAAACAELLAEGWFKEK